MEGGARSAEYIGTVHNPLPPLRQWVARLPGFASQCAVCHSWPAAQVCQPCVARFMTDPACCALCALPLPAGLSMAPPDSHEPVCAACLRERPPLDATLAGVPYAYPWSALISRYKFGGQHGWADFFAGLLLKAPGVAPALGQMQAGDWLIPLPLSAERLQARGFNQAWELASALARQSQTPARADARLLLRLRHTPPQSQLKRAARLANVKGVFQVDPLRAPELAGRRVVLVDDVMTSGASVFSAALALREAGAAHITAVVLARTAPA
ncbi:MAG: ComF family protein [Polaromonas sp.]|nr:ComF family protein [Polaromonas sp.]